MPWWDAQTHADRRPLLALRGRIKAGLRAWFEGEGFTEVECGALAASPGNEAHLHAFATSRIRADGAGRDALSPHLAGIRRQEIAGGGRDAGSSNSPASSATANAPACMRRNSPCWNGTGRGEDVDRVMADTLALVRRAAADRRTTRRCAIATGSAIPLPRPSGSPSPTPSASMPGSSCWTRWTTTGGATATCSRRGPSAPASRSRRTTAGRIFSPRCWPPPSNRRLGLERLTLLTEYPRQEAALARPKPSDPRLSERFELYACGVELANGFGELTDPAEQRARFEAEMDEKQRIHGERYPLDEDFLAALAQMPPASGVALGFDRLVMLAAGAPRIDDVLWTPLPPDP